MRTDDGLIDLMRGSGQHRNNVRMPQVHDRTLHAYVHMGMRSGIYTIPADVHTITFSRFVRIKICF